MIHFFRDTDIGKANTILNVLQYIFYQLLPRKQIMFELPLLLEKEKFVQLGGIKLKHNEYSAELASFLTNIEKNKIIVKFMGNKIFSFSDLVFETQKFLTDLEYENLYIKDLIVTFLYRKIKSFSIIKDSNSDFLLKDPKPKFKFQSSFEKIFSFQYGYKNWFHKFIHQKSTLTITEINSFNIKTENSLTFKMGNKTIKFDSLTIFLRKKIVETIKKEVKWENFSLDFLMQNFITINIDNTLPETICLVEYYQIINGKQVILYTFMPRIYAELYVKTFISKILGDFEYQNLGKILQNQELLNFENIKDKTLCLLLLKRFNQNQVFGAFNQILRPFLQIIKIYNIITKIIDNYLFSMNNNTLNPEFIKQELFKILTKSLFLFELQPTLLQSDIKSFLEENLYYFED